MNIKLTVRLKLKKQVNNYVKVANADESAGQNIRKFVQVKIFNKNIKLQLDSGSNLSIINIYTWKKIGKPTLMVIKKIVHSVTGQKIKFKGEFITNVTLNEKTLKLRLFVMKNTNKLFETD